MSKSAMGSALIAIGILVVFIGFTADFIGLGREPGMGMLQWSAVIVGIIMLVAGVAMRKGAGGAAGPAPAHREPPLREGHGGPEGPP